MNHVTPEHVTPADIEQRKATLVERGKALNILIATAESKRKQRAEGVEIIKLTESRSTGAVQATVRSATSDKTYTVVIDGPVRGRIRKRSCTCRDNRDRGAVCKHMIAVSTKVNEHRRDQYRLLRESGGLFLNGPR